MALSPNIKKAISIALKFILLPVLALGLLYFAFSGIDIKSIWEAIKGANYFYVVLSFLTGYVAFVFIGLRWLIPLEAMGYSGVSKLNSIHSVTITYIANLAVPRAGEVARCTAMNQAEGIPVSKLLGTVILERAIDVIMLGFSILLTIILQYPQMEAFGFKLLTLRQDVPSEPLVSYKTIIIVSVILIALFIYIFRKKLRHTILYHKIVDFSSGMMIGIKTIKHMHRKWAFVYYTILIWFMYYLMIFFMSYAFSQTETLSAANILYLMTVGGLAQLIPVQGGIGAYHTAMKIGIPILAVAAITPEIAMAFATLNHATQTLMQLSTGALAIFFISRAKAKRLEKDEKSNEKVN